MYEIANLSVIRLLGQWRDIKWTKNIGSDAHEEVRRYRRINQRSRNRVNGTIFLLGQSEVVDVTHMITLQQLAMSSRTACEPHG